MGERRFHALNHRPKEILVGVCWPFEANQDGMANGLQLALEEINATGLASGIPMRLVLRDDDGDWQKAKRIAIEFSDNPDMSAVLGYYDDSAAIKASMMYESSRLLHLIVGANNTAMTVDRGSRKIALIWEEDAYGEDLAYQYRVALDALNIPLVYQWSYPRERSDFRTSVNELKGTDADLIFFAGLEPWAGDFLRAARGVGITTDIIGAFSDTPEMRARAGRGLEGAMYFDEYNVDSATPQNQAFVRKYQARFRTRPDTWAAQGYDALYLLANAVRATGSANPLDLSYAIRFINPWQGVNGVYKFDRRGELAEKPLYLNAYRNGVPVTIQESLPAPAPLIR
jgi:branched-chain amino acid transport system substrate-binding protein